MKEMFSKYKFHFKTGDTGEHTRTEESDETGRVIGMYSYKDPSGVLRTVRYRADPDLGYQAYGEGFPQFGDVPLEYYNNVTPTNLLVAQLNTEGRNNESISEDFEAQESVVSTVTDSQSVISPVTDSQSVVSTATDSQSVVSTATDSQSVISTVTDSSIDYITSISLGPKSLSEIESETATKVKESFTEAPTVSPDMNNNKLVPVLLPYGSFHKILIHSGHLYYPVPHALAYSLVPPNYQMVLSIACYHGDCSDAGTCECDLCWEGDNCDRYVDNFLPEFNKEEETAIVSDPWSPEVVYMAQALDGDLGSKCPAEAMICECAETHYSITAGDPNKLFYINNLTGEVYVKEASQVVSGKTYNLTLTARSSRGMISPSPNAHMLTENKNYNTEFNFTLVTGEAENMETGGFLKYLLEITVPQTDGMDLTVEFFTKDIGNGNYTPVLAIFNVEILEKPDGVTFSRGDQPHIEMLLSDEIMTAEEKRIEVDIVGPKEIPLDSAGVYVLIAHCSVRSDNFTFEVIAPEETEVVTVGNLGVKGNHGEPREDGNVINVTFAIYALNNETHLDKEVSFTTKIIVGREILYSQETAVKLVARKDADKFQWPEASAHYNEEEKIVPGHLAEVEIWVDTKIQTITAMTIEVEGVTKDISLCGLKVKSFGRNLPCIDLDTEPFYFPHENPLDGNKVAGLNFSALSNIGFRSDIEHDRLVAIALVRISPTCKKATTELEWRVTFGGGKRQGKATIQVDLTADTSDMSFVNASVKLVNPENIPIRIHQRLWIPFNITIPIDAVVKVEAEARGYHKKDRAVLTVHNMRLVSGGVNIPCPMLYPQPKVVFNPTGPTTQSDVIRAYIGYFTNLGLSHKMNMAQEGDDDLTIEVEVEMTDHPLAEHEKVFPLKFIAEVGKAVAEIDQPMQVLRDGQERADLDVRVQVDNKKPYQSGERINVSVSVVHKTESTAEPINATIRLYLPPYVEFENKVFSNATTVGPVSFITEYGGLDIVITELTYKKNKAFDTLEKPVQTRFVRVVLEEVDKENEDTQYIVLKMEMYGCYLAEKSSSDKYGRHFSVDLQRDIIYFCDLEYDMETLACFSSVDAGSSWKTSFEGLMYEGKPDPRARWSRCCKMGK
ncbi:Adult-specific rigid cuticular protein 12.4 like protein [Argiope bruennichi]|uniref:Adult-specific rigid cuticular protein 12.4 like protein n=1 Tax=Argiope bruennichi TaxID=94029 RepID=A0A8T0EZJ5_ARGBR|nr:Adult-specific rigid cuticular protein 12.4 like protein [Argiope bruennichi]